MVLKWFDTAPAVAFGNELASYVLSQLQFSAQLRNAKFRVRAEKALVQVDRRVREFKGRHSLNFLQRSRLANAFLWTLKDGGCPEDYASELTHWLTVRL